MLAMFSAMNEWGVLHARNHSHHCCHSDLEAFGIEAINHGADAVYIGGPAFGARASAGNDLRDIERLVRHAHRFHSRIFITLNTILRDDELEAARRMAARSPGARLDPPLLMALDEIGICLPLEKIADIQGVPDIIALASGEPK